LDFLYRWRRPIIAVLVIIVLATLLSYTAKLRGHVLTLSALTGLVTEPVGGVIMHVGGGARGDLSSLSQLFRLQQENQRLKSELTLYNSLKLELQEVQADNTRLRGLLYLKNQLGTWRLLAASVVARNPDTWFSTITIGRGSLAGVKVNMSVIVPQGVVGRVVSVSPESAQVMLLLDPSSGAGALDVRSRSAGVVLGRDPITGTLRFELFGPKPDVVPGDAVVTSGLSEYFPKGLLIGQVVGVATSQGGLTETATVKPSVNFNQLETVMVVLSHPNAESTPPLGQVAP
jgi:rod shape-determining protein MreC